MRTFDTLTEAIQSLKERGYNQDFNLHPEWIECTSLNLKLGPELFHVDEVHRFEEMTNPDDSAVLFAISSSLGVKGILVDAYGLYADALSATMIEKLTIDGRTNL